MSDSTHPCDYAFPVAPGDVPYWQPGMTLRDWFAGQALVSVIRQCAGDTIEPEDESRAAMFARKSYSIADAMLAERAKGGAS